MLKQKFYSSALSIDLSYIKSSFYTNSSHYSMIIIRLKITKVIDRLKPDKVSGSYEIVNIIVKVYSKKLVELLTLRFQACVEQAYYSRAFKTVNKITLRKISK